MSSIDIKKTTTTQMKIKKAALNEGKFYVDGEEQNLLQLLTEIFDGCIFDLSVVEKNEIPVED